MNKEGLIYAMVFTFIISFFFVVILSFVNEGTRTQVALNQQIRKQQAILNAMGIPFQDVEDTTQAFQQVQEITRNGETLYQTELDGTTVFAKEFAGSGLWGMIEGVIAVDNKVDRTVGIEIIAHNETPGLGGRIDEAWFKQQLQDEQIINNRIVVGNPGDGDTDKGNGVIDAVTGASRTSDAMQVILDREITFFTDTLGGN